MRACKEKKKMESSDDDNAPEFFKIFMPSFTSKNMWIRPAFVREFIRTLKCGKNVTLKDESGRCWHIGLEKKKMEKLEENKLGWEAFVTHHSLQRGDLLLFKYDVGSCSFNVKIYGFNGCKKKLSNLPTDFNNFKGNYSGSSFDDRGEYVKRIKAAQQNLKIERDPKPEDYNNTLDDDLYFPSRVLRNGLGLEPNMGLRCWNNILWPVVITSKSDGRPVITKGWADFRRRYDIQVNE